YFVEMSMAAGYHQRAYFHALGLHVEQEVADTLMLGSGRVGAREHEHPIGILRSGCPGLLSVNQEVITLVFGTGRDVGQVGTGVGFGVALAPDVLATQDALHVALFLLLSS